MRLAAIDIGSNAARLLINDVIEGPQGKPVGFGFLVQRHRLVKNRKDDKASLRDYGPGRDRCRSEKPNYSPDELAGLVLAHSGLGNPLYRLGITEKSVAAVSNPDL